MNGDIIRLDPPEAEYFKFIKLPLEDRLSEEDEFTLTWLYRAFGLCQEVPKSEVRFFSQRVIDVADRFISLWICFNSIVRERYGEGLNDSDLIYYADQDPLWKEYFNKMYDAEFRENLIQLKALLPIKNMKNKSEVNMPPYTLISVIYQIRNNLFHGRKNPSSPIYETPIHLFTIFY